MQKQIKDSQAPKQKIGIAPPARKHKNGAPTDSLALTFHLDGAASVFSVVFTVLRRKTRTETEKCTLPSHPFTKKITSIIMYEWKKKALVGHTNTQKTDNIGPQISTNWNKTNTKNRSSVLALFLGRV